MAASPSRRLREKILDARAVGAFVSRAAMGAPCEPPRFVSVRSSLDRGARRISTNLSMHVSSVSILVVYPRTLESAFSRVLVSRNRQALIADAKYSGESLNGSPVHRIQGASKMQNQFDLMPLGWAIDDARRIEGLPSEVRTSTVMLDGGGKLRGADRVWLVQSPRRHLPGYLAQGIGRMTGGTMRTLRRERRRTAGCRRGVTRSDTSWQFISIDQQFGD
ncbi:hypothetical protein SAMN05216573_12351 [Bradyrhizobium sp. Rc3b]|nr:hypothetical protein SAMN05216573_12351 [Bradyrhizobium sp. Rc3b]